MLAQRLIFAAVAFGILWCMQAIVYATAARVFEYHSNFWYLYTAVFAILFLMANVSARRFDTKISNGFYVLSMVWLGVIFLFFSSTLSYSLVALLIPGDSPVLLALFLGTALVASVYALINARNLTTKEFTLEIAGLTKPIRLVHLSDVHIGTVHQINFLKRVVTLSNDLKPDLVLMSGDLFDGSAPIHESMLRPLDGLVAPCYFSTGNHEEYEGLSLVKETVSRLSLELLDNKMTEWNGVQIIGVDDKLSLKKRTLTEVLQTLPIVATKPTILMYHTPVEWDMARAHGVDLMLSGHTHNGQIFPFTILVRFAFKYVRGLFMEEGKYLHVTPGTGTWGPPMRLGSKNQVTLLKLVPKT